MDMSVTSVGQKVKIEDAARGEIHAEKGVPEFVTDMYVKSIHGHYADADGRVVELKMGKPQDVHISFDTVRDKNLMHLKKLNLSIFPVNYQDKFYTDALSSGDFTKLAYYADLCVGCIACRLEKKEGGGGVRLYIMTLGVLAPYRRMGIGSKLLKKTLEQCEQSESPIVEVYLHVQTNNDEAVEFYKKFHFEITEEIKNYYKHIEPPDCFVLSKILVPSRLVGYVIGDFCQHPCRGEEQGDGEQRAVALSRDDRGPVNRVQEEKEERLPSTVLSSTSFFIRAAMLATLLFRISLSKSWAYCNSTMAVTGRQGNAEVITTQQRLLNWLKYTDS
ncbi:hypothetical protein R1sor_022702 [Riccia sorocarpa]|uniref:N-acetyltransferase domain-containing protein n=1 Tax=Riccia sorocarpa TaxID=122646 RepID=A0ABD3GM55_9MARC